MKVGVVGIGNIAQKAYLPIYAEARDQADFYFASSQKSTRQLLKNRYGFKHVYENITEILAEKMDGILIHAATKAHYSLIKKCLEAGVHVFVDKPLTESAVQSLELQQLAQRRGLLLMAGFNRRFAPLVQELKATPEKHFLILQKHRINKPQPVKFVIYDLFLHLVDTAVYLLEEPAVFAGGGLMVKDGLLHQAHLQLKTASSSAFLHMDLVSGTNLENYQLTATNGRLELAELTRLTVTDQQQIVEKRGNDWETTLTKRGFAPMVTAFLKGVETGDGSCLRQERVLLSHQLCDELLQQASQD